MATHHHMVANHWASWTRTGSDGAYLVNGTVRSDLRPGKNLDWSDMRNQHSGANVSFCTQINVRNCCEKLLHQRGGNTEWQPQNLWSPVR